MESKRFPASNSASLFASRRLFCCFASIIIISSCCLFFATTLQVFHLTSSFSSSHPKYIYRIRNQHPSGVTAKEAKELEELQESLRKNEGTVPWYQRLLLSFSSSTGNGNSLPSSVSPSLLRIPSPPPSTETEPIVLAYTACGNPNEIEEDLFGLVSLKSLLMARYQYSYGAVLRRYDIHILTNVEDLAEFWNSTHVNYDVYRLTRNDPGIRLFLHSIDELEAATVRVLSRLRQQESVRNPSESSSSSSDVSTLIDKDMVPVTIFKNCAAARLKLPFLLSELNVSKIIYMDWDTITLCDLSRLWHTFNDFYNVSKSTYAYMGFVPSDSSGQSGLDHYREWNLPRHPIIGSINSGVMLLHVEYLMMNALDYWTTLTTIMTDHIPNITTADYWALTQAFPLGDQDVLNILFHRKPDWLYPLPARYNYCLEIELEQNEMPCILHYCGNKLMPVEKGVRMLPIHHPWKASYMFIRYWPLIQATEPPLFRGGPKEIVCKDKE